ncbi:hypothetical protein AB0O06_33005, partial [Streptomyces tauricus]
GPLQLRLSDPFGMCELTRSFSTYDTLTVAPRPIRGRPDLTRGSGDVPRAPPYGMSGSRQTAWGEGPGVVAVRWCGVRAPVWWLCGGVG